MLDEFGIVQNGRERGSELVFVLACELQLSALAGDFLEEAGVFERDRRLVSEALLQADYGWRKLARLAPPLDQSAEWLVRRQQGDEERRTDSIAQWFAGALHKVKNLQRCRLAIASPGQSLSRECLACEAVKRTLTEPGRLAELEGAKFLAIVEYRTRVGARELDRTFYNSVQHRLVIER